MITESLGVPGVLLIKPRVFRDDRGRFVELWQRERYAELGIPGPFVQDNVSVSRAGVLRGLHYQHPQGQGKLVSVLEGTVFDVAVDIRRRSPTFGKWVGAELSGTNGHQLWLPPGFAHGFSVLTDGTVFSYKCTAPYASDCEHTIRWDDPDLAIAWPTAEPIVSVKDREAPHLAELPAELLPEYQS